MKKPWVAVVGLFVLMGCASIPDNGPVTKVNADPSVDQSTVRYSPTGPAKGASPQQIVRGYLDAMLAYPVTTGTAAAFLTPEAARAWKSAAGVQIYVQPQVSPPSVNDNAGGVGKPSVDVDLDVVEDASLDPQGRFSRVNGRKQFTFRLNQTKGQWRITNPQSGFLVNRKFFDDYYRPFNDYFFDQPGKRLVADPIYLPVGEQVSTALVASLLLGPRDLLAKTARTYVPSGTQLRTSVPLRSDGLADVQFSDNLSSLSDRDQTRLSAQIIWTLRQVEEVSGVRITGGDNVLYPGNRGIQSIDSWGNFGPKFGDGRFFGLQKGRIVELSGRDVAAVDGSWGKDARQAVGIAVDSGRLAVVAGGRNRLTTGNFDDSKASNFSGNRFLNPIWDDAGALWALDRPRPGTRLRIFEGSRFREIPIGVLAKFSVESFALSPDGARYAFIADVGGSSKVYVGPVLRNAEDVVVSLGTPGLVQSNEANYTGPRSLSWSSATTVTFLANDSIVGTQIFDSRIDGSSSSGGTASGGALLPDVDAVTLVTTGGNGATQYVTDKTGHTWLLRPGGAWERLGAIGVTGLNAPVNSS